jgi:hypothetical protein
MTKALKPPKTAAFLYPILASTREAFLRFSTIVGTLFMANTNQA